MKSHFFSIYKILILLCVVSFSMESYGQSKKIWLQYADEYFKEGNYSSALKYYQRILNDSLILSKEVIPYEISITSQKLKDKKRKKKDSLVKAPYSAYIPHQIAVCYRKTFDYKRAVEQYQKIVPNTYYPEDSYFLAISLMNIKEYQKAKDNFNHFITEAEEEDTLISYAIQKLIGCNYALDEDNYRKEVKVQLADSVFNKGTTSFAAMYFNSKDRVLFSSAREGGVIYDPNKQDSKFLTDLYYTEKQKDGSWGEAKNFGRPLNSAQNDASGVFNKNGVILFNRWTNSSPNEVAMYLERMVNFKFFEAYKLDSLINYPNSQNINPFISKDGTTLYFSSNRPGGEGGFDIWKIKIDPNGKVKGLPENLGTSINTAFDEKTPFYHAESNTFYFSSKGHNSIGGLDIFKSNYSPTTHFYSKPINLGQPINSSQDDAYMIWDSKLKTGFFSSDREPCPAGHCYHIYTVKNAPIHIYIKGHVYDIATNEKIPKANITFKPIHSDFPEFSLQSDGNGYYHTELGQQWAVFMIAKKHNYFADATNINTSSITKTTTLVHDFYLRRIPKHEIKIHGIEYDFDSANLRPKAKKILDSVVTFLQLNDNISIQLNAHSDSRGADSYNLDLSQRRAQSCVDYLIEKGIASDRLKAIGYGETEPAILKDNNGKPILDANGEKIPLTNEFIYNHKRKKEREKYHQMNRRTAFKVTTQ